MTSKGAAADPYDHSFAKSEYIFNGIVMIDIYCFILLRAIF